MRGAVSAAAVAAVAVALAAAGVVAALAWGLRPNGVGTGVNVSVTTVTLAEPAYRLMRINSFAGLYRVCGGGYTYYIGSVEAGGLWVSLFASPHGRGLAAVYTVGGRSVCVHLAPRLARVVRGSERLGAARMTYVARVYVARLQAPQGLLERLPADARRLVYSLRILEIHAEGTIVYTYGGLGGYEVHLRGVAWVEEAGGGGEVVAAVEDGSYATLRGSMSYLFSQCTFKAWASHNPFAAIVKASWRIAENTCPVAESCSGRPAMLIYPTGRVELSPGGGGCSLSLGCGCHAWSP